MAHAVAAGALGFVEGFVGIAQKRFCIVLGLQQAAGDAGTDGDLARRFAGRRTSLRRSGQAHAFGERVRRAGADAEQQTGESSPP